MSNLESHFAKRDCNILLLLDLLLIRLIKHTFFNPLPSTASYLQVRQSDYSFKISSVIIVLPWRLTDLSMAKIGGRFATFRLQSSLLHASIKRDFLETVVNGSRKWCTISRTVPDIVHTVNPILGPSLPFCKNEPILNKAVTVESYECP